MRKISKCLAVAATVATLGGASVVALAQTGGPGFGPPGYGDGTPGYGPMGYGPMGFMHGRSFAGMMGGRGGPGFADPAARLEALKAELAIRPEQAAAWNAYAKAVQDSTAGMLAARRSVDFDTLRAMTWQEHQAFMAKLFDERAQSFKTMQAAATALLAALDDTQKTHALLPGLLDVGPGMMAWHDGPPWPGFGMMPWGSGGSR